MYRGVHQGSMDPNRVVTTTQVYYTRPTLRACWEREPSTYQPPSYLVLQAAPRMVDGIGFAIVSRPSLIFLSKLSLVLNGYSCFAKYWHCTSGHVCLRYARSPRGANAGCCGRRGAKE